MNYEGQICRGPMERSSFMLPVSVGCSYNACKFCMLFKHLQYRELPLEQVEEEILRVKNAGGSPRRIFLGDGNAFGMSMDRFRSILDLIHTNFPECEMINMDATVTNIQEKSDAELRELSDAGVRRLYLGIESGLDDVLRFMRKDHTLEQAYTQIARMKEAGLIFDAHMMTGIAGKGRGRENAEKTAEFMNRTQPGHLINFSMFLHDKAPLGADIRAGRFVPADELENLEEDRLFLELLDVPGLQYDSFHDMFEFRVRGTLPRDKEKMLKKLDDEIEQEQDLRNVLAYA